MTGHRGRVDDLLRVDCWCRATSVLVSAATVKAGSTGSCGARGCVDPAAPSAVLAAASPLAPSTVDPAQLHATIDILGQLPEIVRAERVRRGLDQRSAARQMGIGAGLLGDIERSRAPRGPTVRTVRMVLAWLLEDNSRALREVTG